LNLQFAIITTLVVLLLFLGFSIVLKDSQKRINRAFFYVAISASIWLIFLFISNLKIGQELLFNKLVYIGSSMVICSLLYLSLNFPRDTNTNRKLLYTLLSATGILAIIIVFTDFIISGINFVSWGTDIKPGPLYWSYPVYSAVCLVISTVLLAIKSHNTDDKKDKKVINFFMIGLLVSFAIGFFTNSLSYYVFGDYSLSQYGFLSIVLFIFLVAYLIIKQNLFNMKIIATQVIVIIISSLLLFDAMTSSEPKYLIFRLCILLSFMYSGYELIKSVTKEIRQRERIQKLAKDLENANEHLKEVDKLKDDFLSMASHELNTPIAAIKGYLSMILVEGLGGKIPDKARTYLESVFQSATRLANMVKDLLNVSRIESGRIHIIYEQKPVEDVINQAITEVMSKAREAGHSLTFEEPKHKMPATWFDITRVTEVLINILGNSIKYTPNGGKIVVRVVNDDQKLVVSVEDNGKGIPKDRQQAVFEKFTQVDVLKDEVKGTGLGMYISKKFIELQKGKIWFHSDGDGKGTTFFFSLPILAKKPFDAHDGEGEVLH